MPITVIAMGIFVLVLSEQLLKDHEGLRLKLYKCTAGRWTIGYGRNLEDRGISRDEAEFMLANDIRDCVSDLESFSWWSRLSVNRQAALVDMRFCLGPTRFRKFRKMIAALELGDHAEAAAQILDSKFADQTDGVMDGLAGDRAKRLAEMMIIG